MKEVIDLRLVNTLSRGIESAPDIIDGYEAIVLPSTDGIIHFYLIKPHDCDDLDSISQIPASFMFDMEVRIKSVKIGYLRVYGKQVEPVKCLIVFTFDDFAFVFYDFTFEVNTQHVTFKKHMQQLIAGKTFQITDPAGSPQQVKRKKVIKNPILLRMMEHFKGS